MLDALHKVSAGSLRTACTRCAVFRISDFGLQSRESRTAGRLSPATMPNDAKSPETRVRAQQAKEFLIAQVLDEAQRENVSLSEIERKMLEFTESFDSAAYEKKIADLLRNARERSRRESPEAATRWKQAILDLIEEDHYLEAMLAQSVRSPERSWKVVTWAAAVGMVLSILVAIHLSRDPDGAVTRRAFERLFGWMSGGRGIHNLRIGILVLVVGVLLFALELARRGKLGLLAKGMWIGMRAGVLGIFWKKRSRE